MKSCYIAAILFAIGLLLIFMGGIITIVDNLSEDENVVLYQMRQVEDSYTTLAKSMEFFIEEEKKVFQEIQKEEIILEENSLYSKFSEEENILQEIERQIEELGNLCRDVYYPDTTINSKCRNYKLLYEEANNRFVQNIEKYNQKIRKQENGDSSYYSIRQYLDYNYDGKYSGKQE